MPEQPWHTILDSMRPYVFKILTPNGSGTGFQIFSNQNGLCGIATAYHVIDHADEWHEPIKLLHFDSKKTVLIKNDERVIYSYKDKDLAFIVFNRGDLPLKDDPPLLDSNRYLKQGGEISWCGFPVMALQDLCFFSGYVSCFLEEQQSYLIDGVAINGVSGGPAFDDSGTMIGVVSAYIPNVSTGQTLPGLCVVRSVASYEEDLKKLRSLPEAEQQKKEQEVESKSDEKEKT